MLEILDYLYHHAAGLFQGVTLVTISSLVLMECRKRALTRSADND